MYKSVLILNNDLLNNDHDHDMDLVFSNETSVFSHAFRKSVKQAAFLKKFLRNVFKVGAALADRTRLTFFKGTFVFFERPLTRCFPPPPSSFGLASRALINPRYESGVATFWNLQRASLLSSNEFPLKREPRHLIDR